MSKVLLAVILSIVSVTTNAVTVSCFSTGRTTVSAAGPWPFDSVILEGEWVPFGTMAGPLPPPKLLGATTQVQGNVITLDMYASDTALPPGIDAQPQANPPLAVAHGVAGPLAQGTYTLLTGLHIVNADGSISDPCGPPAGSTIFTIEQAAGPVETVTAIEYYWAAADHYFITWIPDEIAALDNGVYPGWVRTGLTFNVFAPGESGGVGVSVCRFYGLPSAGLDSHFYTANADECAAIPTIFHGAWQLESADIFDIRLPDPVTGACAMGFVPVYRLWNQRSDSDHRFTTDYSVAVDMITRSYVSEGWGPGVGPNGLGVAMCAPQ